MSKEDQIQKRRMEYMKIIDAKKNVNMIFNKLLEMIAMDLPQRPPSSGLPRHAMFAGIRAEQSLS